jgi:hypothetical protein
MLFGIVIAAVLTQEQASIKTTPVVSDHSSKLYASDGGVDYAIQAVRSNSSLCPSVFGPTVTSLPPITLNGHQVDVTCRTIEGGFDTTVASDYSVIVTNYRPPDPQATDKGPKCKYPVKNTTFPVSAAFLVVTCNNAPANTKIYVGGKAMYNAGGFSFAHEGTVDAQLVVQGRLVQVDDPATSPTKLCTTNASLPTLVVGSRQCVPPGPPPDPQPTIRVPGTLAPIPTMNVTCDDGGVGETGSGGNAILYPGTYTSVVPISGAGSVPIGSLQPGQLPKFNNHNRYYFTSGVYYFNFAPPTANDKEFAMEGASIFGGIHDPAAAATRIVTSAAPCKVDSDLAADKYDGQGTTFIFGGASLFDIHASTSELFYRIPGSMDAGATPGTSLFAWADSSRPAKVFGGSAAYNSFNPGTSADRCTCAFVTDKSGQQILFHGLTYVPYSPIDVYINQIGAYSPFLGGIVANAIVAHVENGSGVDGVFAGSFTTTGPSPRRVLITATAHGATGERDSQSAAVVQIDATPPKVDTWRNQS